jgi:enoyl-CoA hydratase/carnithine racemase
VPWINCEGDVSDELLVTADGAVRVVTINRPDALNVAFSKHLAQAAIEISEAGHEH